MDTDVYDLTLQLRVALQEGTPGLTEFKRCFRQASEALEAGHDAPGRQAVRDLLPHLRQFVQFFHGLLLASMLFLSEDEFRRWQHVAMDLADALARFNSAWEADDMAAVCDVLRFDLSEIMDECGEAFAQFTKALPDTLSVPLPAPGVATCRPAESTLS